MRLRPIPLLIGLTIALFADVLILGRGFYKGDLYAYHFPMKKLVRDAGDLHWNEAYHAGQPLAANPAYEVFYPPQWLIFAGTYTFAFQLHILAHILIAVIGMYLFLRSLDVGEHASAFGAAAFAFGAPYLSLVIRLPFLFALTWLPLVAMFARRVVLHGDRKNIALGALCFGMQALIGEPVTVLQTGAIAGIYALIVKPRALGKLAIMFALGLVIASVHLVPAIDHAGDSVRAEGFSWQVASNWSTPPKRLAEIVYPQIWRAFPDERGEQRIRTLYDFRIEPYISDIYPGLLIVVLAVAGIATGVRGRWWVAAGCLLSILMALGSFGPFFRFLHDHRLIPSVRYPEKFLLAGLFVLITFGAFVLDRVAKDARLRKLAIALVIAWLAIGVIIWMTRLGVATPVPQLAEARAIPWHGYWMMNFARGAAAIALLMTTARRWWPAALVAFACLDPLFIHFGNAARTSRDYFDPPAVAQNAQRDGRLFHRAAWDEWEGNPLAYEHFATAPQTNLVLRNAMYPFTPAAFGFEMALEDDVDQTALMTSTEFTRAALDIKRRTGAWHPWFLHAAGVRYVAEWLPMADAQPRGVPVEIADRGPAPRFWRAKRLIPAADRASVAQHIVTSGADAGDVFVEPGFTSKDLLVAAITRHKYWRAFVDGRPADIVPVNIGFMGVVAPPHAKVRFEYRNPLIVPSAIASLVGLAIALFLARK